MTSRTVSSEDTTRITAFTSLSISLVLTWERMFSDGDVSLFELDDTATVGRGCLDRVVSDLHG